MPLDQTAWFKARIKKIQQKVNGEAPEPKRDHQRTTLYTSLCEEASAIGHDAWDLTQLVLSRRKDYLAFNAPVCTMSDSDRTLFDKDCEKALSHLKKALERLSTKIDHESFLQHEKKHLSFVVDYLATSLKYVGKIVADLRKLRLFDAKNKQKLWKLSGIVTSARKTSVATPPTNSPFASTNLRHRKHSNEGDRDSHEMTPDSQHASLKEHRSTAYLPDVFESPDDELPLLPEQRESLLKENTSLFEKFSTAQSELDAVESSIAEIQRLQDTFAEKVFDQERDIELINESAIHTTENLRDGNEWIRQAISNSASRRVVVLFCILVITFTLIFLDWYNP